MVQRDMGLKGNKKQTEVEKQPKKVKRAGDHPGSNPSFLGSGAEKLQVQMLPQLIAKGDSSQK